MITRRDAIKAALGAVALLPAFKAAEALVPRKRRNIHQEAFIQTYGPKIRELNRHGPQPWLPGERWYECDRMDMHYARHIMLSQQTVTLFGRKGAEYSISMIVDNDALAHANVDIMASTYKNMRQTMDHMLKRKGLHRKEN